LHNAALYTPVSSTLDIRVRIKGETYSIEISDDGPGIPKDVLPRLFDKFYRAPGTKAGGTGLGLSIARGFVEAHGGTLTASNTPSGGACFTIKLPFERKHPTFVAVESE
jgi:two-component system sensor histidine kinase KdpD